MKRLPRTRPMPAGCNKYNLRSCPYSRPLYFLGVIPNWIVFFIFPKVDSTKLSSWKPGTEKEASVDHLAGDRGQVFSNLFFIWFYKKKTNQERPSLCSPTYLEHTLCFLWPPWENYRPWKVLSHCIVLSPCCIQCEHQRTWAPTTFCLL